MLGSLDRSLPRATAESQGVSPEALLAFVEALDSQIREMHSVMVLRHGNVIAEGWWSPYSAPIQHKMFSLSKSFTATAIGMLIDDGRLSLDDAVITYFPDEAPDQPSDNLKAMQIRHLLSMSTGHEVEPGPRPTEARSTWTWEFLNDPIVYAPGTHFLYNTAATYVLSAILQRITGERLIDYLQPRLFAPLGIAHPRWEQTPAGISAGGFGLVVCTEDVAKLGQLYLQKGKWAGSQLLSAAWVAEATSKQVSNGDPTTPNDWAQGYGYQFWRCQPEGAYRGDGAFGQYCVVLPEADAVVAITSSVQVMQEPLNLVWEYLLPAFQSGALQENKEAHAGLVSRLETLAIAPYSDDAKPDQTAQVLGREWQFAANELDIRSASLHFRDGAGILHLGVADRIENIYVGHDEWTLNETEPFGIWPLHMDSAAFSPTYLSASGGWQDSETYVVVCRFLETPNRTVLSFKPTSKELNLTVETLIGDVSISQHILQGVAIDEAISL